MNKTVSIIITFSLVIAIGIVFSGKSNPESVQNIEIKDGVQYVRINARGGYSPNISEAKAGIPTKIIMKTNGAYDCSASLVIKSINYQKILPQTGETEIDVGIKKVGEKIQGVCGMGMYSFIVNFN